MDKIRILFISRAYPPVVGGIENQNWELSRWLPEFAAVKTISNGKGKKFLPLFLPYAAVRAVFEMRKYDALLLGDGVLSIVGWLVKLFHQKPVICVVHGLDITFKSFIYQKLWVGFFLQKMDKLIAVGNETVRIGSGKKIPAEKFVFIPNGVDTQLHIREFDRQNLDAIMGFKTDDRRMLLTSGRLAKRKGVAWFIRNVMPRLSDSFFYVVVGNGPDKKNILQAIDETGLKDRVRMLGYVSNDVRNMLFSTCDLFVQPNIKVAGDMEGFGISVIEAGSCEIPVLASRLEGLQDAIKEGQNGFLVEHENAQAYAEKIGELFHDKGKLQESGRSSCRFIKENYDWTIIAKRYVEEIEALV